MSYILQYSIMIYLQMSSFFSFYRFLIGARIFVTQRGPAELVTRLAHWISLTMEVYSTLYPAMYLYLHFIMYRSFRYWAFKKFPPIAQRKKETLQTWIFSIAPDLSSALETREGRRDDR